MKYRALRKAVTENDMRLKDLAAYLGMEPMSVSNRMSGRISWRIDECYKVMRWLGLPESQVYKYFPPNGMSGLEGENRNETKNNILYRRCFRTTWRPMDFYYGD